MTVDNKQLIFAGVALTAVSYLVYRKYKQSKRSLLERVGGEAAVDAAVKLFYKKMLSDPRVKSFFEHTSMAHQANKQKNFLMYVLDGGNKHKYKGLAMDAAHRRLVKEQGLNDAHFDATAENLNNTFVELGVADDVRKEIMTAVASLRDQVLCRGQWAIPQSEQKTLYERLGGAAAVEAAVDKFYKRMLSDERVARFFRNTNMAHQRQKQINFMSYALGAPKKYTGLAMDAAHRRLIEKEGMNDSHFDATVENLDLTLEELGIAYELRGEVKNALEGLREQTMCRGKWSKPSPEELKLTAGSAAPQKTLFERIGGDAAVEAAVDKFYKRMLADERVARFFRNTNMAHQRQKQINFMSYALGSPKKYTGLAMDVAHRRLVEKEGMNDSHFDATVENLDLTLAELGVPKDLRLEVGAALEGLREQTMCRGKWAKA
jgi:hemoglobin